MDERDILGQRDAAGNAVVQRPRSRHPCQEDGLHAEMEQGWRTAERGIDPQGRRRQVTARSTSILNKTALQQCSAVFVFVFVMAMPLRASTQAKGWSQAANSRNGKARRPSDQPSRRATMKNTRLPRPVAPASTATMPGVTSCQPNHW